jgi:hypothetical protein
MKTFPRPIVVTRKYGSSFFENLQTNAVLSRVDPYDIIESPALIKAAVNGLSWQQAKSLLIEEGFSAEAIEDVDHWGWSRMGEILVSVINVSGPYIIKSYDGMDCILEKDQIAWRE